MSARPHLICFDLDGTLEDSRVDMTAAAHRVRAGLGLPPRDDDTIRPHVNKGMRALYELCFDDHLSGQGPGQPRYDDVEARYLADYLAHIAEGTQLYEGVPEMLGALGELARLAVVTNKPERHSRALLEALGLHAFFGAVVGGDTCAAPKPSPLPVQHAAGALGFDLADLPASARAFHVGDTAGDMKCARAAGVTSVWCRWGYVDRPGDEPYDLVAERPSALPAVIKGAL